MYFIAVSLKSRAGNRDPVSFNGWLTHQHPAGNANRSNRSVLFSFLSLNVIFAIKLVRDRGLHRSCANSPRAPNIGFFEACFDDAIDRAFRRAQNQQSCAASSNDRMIPAPCESVHSTSFLFQRPPLKSAVLKFLAELRAANHPQLPMSIANKCGGVSAQKPTNRARITADEMPGPRAGLSTICLGRFLVVFWPTARGIADQSTGLFFCCGAKSTCMIRPRNLALSSFEWTGSIFFSFSPSRDVAQFSVRVSRP